MKKKHPKILIKDSIGIILVSGTLLHIPSVKDLNHMLNTSIKDAPNFMRVSISSIKKFYLKNTHELLSKKLCDNPPDFIFSIYYHQAIDLIESKIYKPLTPKSKKKPPQTMCSIFFENKGVEFTNIVCILRDPDIVISLPSSSVKFPNANGYLQTDSTYIYYVFQFQ